MVTAAPVYNCDGQDIFFCPTASGTCYVGEDGYVGCCSVSSCAPRTICYPYTHSSMPSCDLNTGACRACTDPALPYCYGIQNNWAQQYIIYCDSISGWLYTSYANLLSVELSTAYLPNTTTSATPRPSVTLVPTTSSTNPTNPTTSPSPSAAVSLSTPIPTATNTVSPSPTTEPPIGAIAGGVVGSVAGFAGLIVLLVMLYRKRRANRNNNYAYHHAQFAEDKSGEDLNHGARNAEVKEDKAIGLGIHTGPAEVPGSEGVMLLPPKSFDSPNDFYNVQPQTRHQHFIQQQDAHRISEAPSPLQLSNNSPNTNSNNSVSNLSNTFLPSPNPNLSTNFNLNHHVSLASTMFPSSPYVVYRPGVTSVSRVHSYASGNGGAVFTPSPLVPQVQTSELPALPQGIMPNNPTTGPPQAQIASLTPPLTQSLVQNNIQKETRSGDNKDNSTSLPMPRPTTATRFMAPWAEVGYQSPENAMQFGFRDTFLPVVPSSVGGVVHGSRLGDGGSGDDIDK